MPALRMQVPGRRLCALAGGLPFPERLSPCLGFLSCKMCTLMVPTFWVREGRARASPRACLLARAPHLLPGSLESRVGSPGWGSWVNLRDLPALRVCALPWGQEALRKIITTLAVKNEEIQNFIYSLKQMLLNVEVRPAPPGGRPWGR